MMTEKVGYPFDPPERLPQLITHLLERPSPIIRVRCTTVGSVIHRLCTAFLAAAIHSSTHFRHFCAGLHTTLDLPPGVAHRPRLDRALGLRLQGRSSRSLPRRAPRTLYDHFILMFVSVLTATPLRRPGAPSKLYGTVRRAASCDIQRFAR